MSTIAINLSTQNSQVTAVTVTAVLRADNGLAPAGVSVPFALTAGTPAGSPLNYPFTCSFTDSTPAPLYLVSATFTVAGIPIPAGPFVVRGVSPAGPTPLEKFSVTVAPSLPLGWSDLAIPLRLDNTAEQPYIAILIAAAVDYAQDCLEMSLMPQTIAAVFNAEDVKLSPPIMDYPWDPLSPMGTPLGVPSFATWGTFNRAPVIDLPRGPVSSIVSMTDGAGNAIANYKLERTSIGDRIRFTGTALYPVTVTYCAGYASVNSIPAGIKVAIMAHVGTLYANRASANAGGAKAVPHSLEDFYRLKARRIPCG